jgi:hypothetical protein
VFCAGAGIAALSKICLRSRRLDDQPFVAGEGGGWGGLARVESGPGTA